MDVCRPCHFAWRLAFALRCAVFSQSKSSDIGNINSCFAAYIHGMACSDIFLIHAMPIFHYGTWVTVPWLLWLSVCILGENNNSEKRPYRFAVGLFILLAVVTASDLSILPWFIAPAIVAVLLLYVPGANKKGDAATQNFYWTLLVPAFYSVSFWGGWTLAATEMVAHDRILSGFSLKYLTYTIENVLVFMGKLGWRHPIAAIVWLAFMFFILSKMYFVLSHWRKSNFRLSLPKSFIALFVHCQSPQHLAPWRFPVISPSPMCLHFMPL